MSTPRVPRDCYLYRVYLYVSLAPISSLMRIQRDALMRGEAGQEAGVLNNNMIYLIEWKPRGEDSFSTFWVLGTRLGEVLD